MSAEKPCDNFRLWERKYVCANCGWLKEEHVVSFKITNERDKSPEPFLLNLKYKVRKKNTHLTPKKKKRK